MYTPLCVCQRLESVARVGGGGGGSEMGLLLVRVRTYLTDNKKNRPRFLNCGSTKTTCIRVSFKRTYSAMHGGLIKASA